MFFLLFLFIFIQNAHAESVELHPELYQTRSFVTYTCIKTFYHSRSINTIACQKKDPTCVYFSSYGNKVYTWDWKKNKTLDFIPISKDGNVGAFQLQKKHNDMLFCCDLYKPIVDIVRLGKNRKKERLVFNTPAINTMSLHPLFGLLAYGDDAGFINIVSYKNSKMKVSRFHAHKGYIWSLIFDEERELLASGGYMQPVKIWSIRDEKCIASLATGEELCAWDSFLCYSNKGRSDDINRVTAIVFHPTKKDMLLTGSEDITVWDFKKERHQSVLSGHTRSINSLLFHPNNADIVYSCSDDKTIRIWSLREGRCLAVLKGHQEAVKSIALCPHDPSILISGSWDKTIRIWKISFGIK